MKQRPVHRLLGAWCATACLLAVLGATACAGPERAPHQPLGGVDTDKNEVENPYDTRPASQPTRRSTGK